MKRYYFVSIRGLLISLMTFLLVAIMAGCAGVNGPRFTQLDSPPGEDQALVYFYRPGEESWNVKGGKFNLYVNGEYVGALPYGGYFSRPIKSGKTVITSNVYGLHNFVTLIVSPIGFVAEQATKKPGRVDIDLAAGEVLFVKLRATDEFSYIAGNLYVIDKDTAMMELPKTKLVRQ